MASTPKNNLELHDKRGGNTAFFRTLAVAVSGGLDSMALLHAAMPVFAFHVHHGLSDDADDWLQHVARFCAQNHIQLITRHLDASTRKNAQSIEDWARQGRYTALTEMAHAHQVTHIWLAQHQDDQIETYLLQKNRGAGVRGLSAMPQSWVKHNITWQRPWLNATRAQLAAYVAEHAIAHIHDASNDDTRFARNALRIKVRQMIEPQRSEILAEIKQAQQQHAQELDWARHILATHHAPHRADIGESARLSLLDAYTMDEQAILLRTWLGDMGWRMPKRAALNELIKQLNHARADQHMCWRHADGLMVAKYRQHIIAAPAFDGWFLPTHLKLEPAWTLCGRQGGEQFRLSPNQPRMTLKDAYQKAGIAPMLRSQLPLIYRGADLIYVVGVGEVY